MALKYGTNSAQLKAAGAQRMVGKERSLATTAVCGVVYLTPCLVVLQKAFAPATPRSRSVRVSASAKQATDGKHCRSRDKQE